MIKQCRECGSTRVIRKGTRQTASGLKQRFRCVDCGETYSVLVDENHSAIEEKSVMVFTAAVSGCAADLAFFNALEYYCRVRDAKLVIMPIRYKNPTKKEEDAAYDDDEIDPYLAPYVTEEPIVNSNVKFRALCDLKIQATADSPLTGMEPLAKGYNTIIGHPQLQMKTIMQRDSSIPLFLTTTGCVTLPVFSKTKAGYKAHFHHSASAIVVEFDSDGIIHMRQLNFDGVGFYDLDAYYTDNTRVPNDRVEAVIVGDEHVIFMDQKVKAATYTDEDSIMNVLDPKVIVRHDVLDCYAISHHHRHNFFVKYKKGLDGLDNIATELEETLSHILNTTREDQISVIVASNHNDHLCKWLNEADPKSDQVNAKLYHYLMYSMIDHLEETGQIGNPFKMYSNLRHGDVERVKFLGRNDSFMVLDIELADHGDAGFNGSRGSRKQYSNLSKKTVIGHSHNPGIEKSCYQVGTSTKLRLEYNTGPSNWANTHCVIYPNGKRQLITIINGKWRMV